LAVSILIPSSFAFGQTEPTLFANRDAESRAKMVTKFGGSEESEKAVELALKWIVEHQRPDGGWSFDHRHGRCQGRCVNPGSASDARLGATGLALLPLLGAGQTHKEGQYKTSVRAGLYYLASKQKADGSFHESQGSMYSHGI